MRLNEADPARLPQICIGFLELGQVTPTNKDWAVGTGAIDAIVNAMRKHRGDKDVQRACASAVSTLSLYSLNVQTYAGNVGAVELVVDMMRRWPEDPSCQMGGNSGCFMDFSAENRARFAKHGGIEAMLDAIRNHFDNPDVVVQSWYGFSSGTQRPNAEHFARAGGLEWAVRCTRAHPKSFRVREEIMQALRTPLENATNRLAMVEAGYLQDLVDTMRDAPMDYHQICPACANLGFFGISNKTHRVLAHKAGATREALHAVINFPKMKPSVGWAEEFDLQYTVYDDCLRVLVQMSTLCEAHKYLVEADAVKLVQGVLARGGRKAAAGTDFGKMGWGSSDHLIRKFGHALQERLTKPCVESEADVPFEWMWYFS